MNSTDLVRRFEKQLYSHEAFKNADKLERIFIYLVSGAKVSTYQLKSREKEYLALMERAYALLFEHRSEREALKIFRRECEGSNDWTAPKVMHNAKLMFGHFEDCDRRVQRGIVRETLLQRLRIAEEFVQELLDGGESGGSDVAAAEKIVMGYLKELRELDQLHNLEEAKKIDVTIPMIEFTDDPEALAEPDQDAEVTIIEE